VTLVLRTKRRMGVIAADLVKFTHRGRTTCLVMVPAIVRKILYFHGHE
jgi:hypothetical protein